MKLKSAGKSDPGLERPNNEDRFHGDPDRGIFIVIDGVGGHAAGEQAADIALSKLRARLERPMGSAAERIHEAITIANNEIYQAAQENEDWRGMACVLTVAVVEDGHATIGHVGDTRLYKLRHGRIQKITHDHSPVGEREDKGELSELEAMLHPRRNEVYRDVGTEVHEPDDQDFIELIEMPFEQDSALLLCSDGLSDLVTQGQVLRIVESHASDPQQVVEKLVKAANDAGGKDNVTVLFAAGDEFPAPAKPSKDDGDAQTRKPPPDEKATGRLRAADVEEGGGGGWTFERFNSPRTMMLFGVVLIALNCLLLVVVLLGQWPKIREALAWGGPPDGPAASAPGRKLAVGGGGENTYATIKEALDDAQPGDTVEVSPGEYREQVVLKEGVALLSHQPYAASIRLPPDVPGPRAAVVADHIKTGRVSGFAVVGDEVFPLDTGVWVVSSGVEVSLLEVTGATVAGVQVEGESSATLSANIIRANRGSGVVVRGEARPRLINNLIIDNGGGDAGAVGAEVRPGVEVSDGARPVLVGNVIAGNGAEGVSGLPEGADASAERENYFGGDLKANGRGKVRRAGARGTETPTPAPRRRRR